MQQLSEDGVYATGFETALVSILTSDVDLQDLADADGEAPEVNVAETYEEAGVLTRDRGLVLQMSDGAQVRLTIHAYTPAGAR